jgi:hypothetical protein
VRRESAEEEKRKARVKRRESEALGRRNPPFAKSAKDGAPSSSIVGGMTDEKPRKTREKASGLKA